MCTSAVAAVAAAAAVVWTTCAVAFYAHRGEVVVMFSSTALRCIECSTRVHRKGPGWAWL